MTKKKKIVTTVVYVVTSGSYSDFAVDSVFSTKQKAEEYINKRNQSGLRHHVNDDIEEYELDSYIEIPNSPHKFKNFYTATMYRSGDITRITDYSGFDVLHPEETQEEYTLVQDCNFNEQKHQFDNFYKLVAVVNADSREHAIKKIADKRSELLRKGLWPLVADRRNGPYSISIEV